MRREAAADAGYVTGAALPGLGRASRCECGAGRELWALPAADEPVATRLLRLGATNVGGFIDGGIAGGGVWLVRTTSGVPLGELFRARKGAWPWREAVAVAIPITRALAACEKASLFAGPVSPEAVHVLSPPGDGEPAARLPAAALVAALVGAADASAGRGASTVSPLWTPPAQADGAVWDAAANRYALGLLLYRLLAGEHPFAGAGLRHALGEAVHREAPPFVEAIARELPAGLQSLTLRALDPEVSRRPASAAEIGEELAAFVAPPVVAGIQSSSAGSTAEPRALRPRPGSAKGALSAAKESRGLTPGGSASGWEGWPRSLWRLWPIAAGGTVALASLALLAPAPAKPRTATVAPEAPLTAARTDAATCATCHGRQSSEWRRSVMAHAVKSPLFNALESLIEEQVGRDDRCPNGAGILRRADPTTACRDEKSGLPVTGSGGEHWCVNCHSPIENLETALGPWDGRAGGDARSRRPVRDLLGERASEGVSCGFCHEVHGPVSGRGSGRYEGNATWTSFLTGSVFAARPEDARGLLGIGNSGYDLRPEDFLAHGSAGGANSVGAHLRAPTSASAYLRSSEFCGSCHDVRLFGTDALGAGRGEHFKRLRNAYSEWAAWATTEARAGRTAATCQGCHMSTYPGVCESDAGGRGDPECPKGSRFSPRAAGAYPKGRVADNSSALADVTTHYFSGVDVPLSREFPQELVDEPTVDAHGVPLSARRRRDLLLRHTFRFALGDARRSTAGLEIPIEIENVGAGHRVPAGFSQEREIWVHLAVRDQTGRIVYEVGHVERGDEDLHDKVFDRVTTGDGERDGKGRPLGLFGADVRDGPDVPRWTPPPILGGVAFRGLGLVNFQNGFLRCVRCIGSVEPDGQCAHARPSDPSRHRADDFADGDYDLDTGECRSNLTGMNAFIETYFPVGALDAQRGLAKGPDAIIDTRSLPPGVPVRYTFTIGVDARRAPGPYRVEARLLFRAFPPFLIKAFAAYERAQSGRGLRPSGPLVTEDMLARLEIVELARANVEIR